MKFLIVIVSPAPDAVAVVELVAFELELEPQAAVTNATARTTVHSRAQGEKY